MTSYLRPPSNNLMKLDCQNGKHKSRVCPGWSELHHKIIGKMMSKKGAKIKKDANKKKDAETKNSI